MHTSLHWFLFHRSSGVQLTIGSKTLISGDHPFLVLTQGDNRTRVDLTDVRLLVAALADGATELAELLAAGDALDA